MQVVAVFSRYRFASGAEEKIVRTFQAPSDFVHSLRNICGIATESEGDLIINCKYIGFVPNKTDLSVNVSQVKKCHFANSWTFKSNRDCVGKPNRCHKRM